MTEIIKNGTPRIYYTGTQDLSAKAPVVVNEERPMHMPYIFTFAERGETTPFYGSGAGLKGMLGAETFNPRGKYYSHQTLLLDVMNQAANACMVERLRAEGSKTATLQLALDLLPTQVPTYQRLPSGAFELDSAGAKIPTGTTVPGFIGMWIVRIVPNGKIGVAETEVGSQTEDGVQSTIYPYAEFEVSSFGKFGDNVGIKMYPVYTNGTQPVDEELVRGEKALLLKAEFFERTNPRISPTVVRTLAGAPDMSFMLKPDTLNERTNTEYFIDDVLLKAYRDLKDYSKGVPAFGPFSKIHVYHDNVETVSKAIHTTEKGLSDIGDNTEEDYFLTNIFQGKDLNGYAYHSYVLRGVLDGAISLDSDSIHYCMGGADGDTSEQALNDAVAAKLANFGSGEYLYGNKARYPFSAFYDTGFDMPVKLLIPNILAVRPNVHVTMGCQVAGPVPNTISEDSSVAIALRAALRSQAESTFFGTSCCRGVIVGHACKVAGIPYKKYVPAVFELAIWRAKYMGAGDGRMKSNEAYDQSPNNQVRFITDLTNLDKPFSVRNKDWDNGLVWFEDFDTRTAFCAGVQTVMDNDSSILNNDINMQIMCELNTVCFMVWRELAGNAKLTQAQFIQRSNEKLLKYIQFRFDGRGVFEPETFFTEADVARGSSWSCKVNFYGNTAKTVSTATVVTHRLEDLV